MVYQIITLVSAILFLTAVGIGIHTYGWVSEAMPVSGTVVEMIQKSGSKSSTYAPRVSYEVDGSSREFVSSQSSNPPAFSVGDKVRVALHERKGKVCIATFGELYGLPAILGSITLCVSLATLLLANGGRILKLLHPHLG